MLIERVIVTRHRDRRVRAAVAAGLTKYRMHLLTASAGPPLTASSPPLDRWARSRPLMGHLMGLLKAAMITGMKQGLRAVSAKPLVRSGGLGDLNPGWARTQTALAARVAAVWIGSAWTDVLDRSALDALARW
jgi:hypothetical protein